MKSFILTVLGIYVVGILAGLLTARKGEMDGWRIADILIAIGMIVWGTALLATT